MHTVPHDKWTDDEFGRVKQWHAEGLSSRQMGERLGRTRNSVIGKLTRAGLSVPRRPNAPQRKPRTQRKRQQGLDTGIANHMARKPSIPFVDEQPDPEMIDSIIPLGQRCSILDLTESKCRWPIGDPCSDDFFFCGGKAADGLPYCGYHCRVAYQPPKKRAAA